MVSSLLGDYEQKYTFLAMNKVNTPAITANNPLVSYSGAIDSQAISVLLAQVEKNLASLNSPADTKKKILGIMIELLQNILHHCPPSIVENKEHPPAFLLKKNRDGFILTASNLIHKNKIAGLKNRIETINSYTAEELKSQYQNHLENGRPISENAGLGLMDIHRKSGKPILVKFASASNNYCLFTVKVLV